MKLLHTTQWILATALFVPPVLAQAPNPAQRQVQESASSQVPLYRVEVVARSTAAINYRNRGGSTTIDFEGTPLLPKSNGEAKVESKQGYIEIEVEFDELEPATKFGPEYLTYVMWAITPEGRATNLGEVLLNGNRSKLNVTTELQSFGLVVTAEPYFAVSQPSDVVVMENIVRDDTRGNVEMVYAKYELLKRGTYTSSVQPGGMTTRVIDRNVPLELYEARNAVELARFAGADTHASDTYMKAQQQLQQAEAYQARNADKKATTTAARAAVQTAEDARLIAIERIGEQRLAQERELAASREAQAQREAAGAQAQVVLEAERRRLAEQQAMRAEQATATANRESAEVARQAALDRQRAEAEGQQAEASRIAALAAREAAERDAAAQARADAVRLEQERANLRGELQQQLNVVLETRRTARGLIVNLSDVLFDVDQTTLQPGAREKLAKVAGIVLAHPDLQIEVEGHTDSSGSDEYNQALSERRASAVNAFLVEQGLSAGNLTAEGFGESQPVATNVTAEGRQQNRRVELVISGESIASTDTQASPLALNR